MGGWHITSWDLTLARGTIRSGIGELPFDAAVADVADFRLGEEVDVTLVPRWENYAVTRVSPIAWRDPPSPPCRPSLGAFLDNAREVVRDRSLSLRGFADDVLTVAIAPESYERERTLEFIGCVLVQMPTVMDDVANVSAYAADAFAKTCPEIVANWPAFDARFTVFRLEPQFFGQGAGYVVALDGRVT